MIPKSSDGLPPFRILPAPYLPPKASKGAARCGRLSRRSIVGPCAVVTGAPAGKRATSPDLLMPSLLQATAASFECGRIQRDGCACGQIH
jgi:hypothetical protein